MDRLSDFGEILFTVAERHADKGHMTKTVAILKIVISPYLIKNRPILIKFGTLRHILNPITGLAGFNLTHPRKN